MNFERYIRIYKTMKESLELEKFHNPALSHLNERIIAQIDDMLAMLCLTKHHNKKR